MSKFQPNDKVRCYDSRKGIRLGFVYGFNEPNGLLTIKFDDINDYQTVYAKQCRKLIPKKCRRVWVNQDIFRLDMNYAGISVGQRLDWIEFIEVIKKEKK